MNQRNTDDQPKNGPTKQRRPTEGQTTENELNMDHRNADDPPRDDPDDQQKNGPMKHRRITEKRVTQTQMTSRRTDEGNTEGQPTDGSRRTN